MKLSLAILVIMVIMCPAAVYAESDDAQAKESDFVRELTYRQREYQSQHSYLAEKEARIAEELNSDISLQNAEPTAATLQRIDNLKARILEYLQDQIKNDRDYISYLEMRLSELLDYKFPTLKAIQKFDEAQVAPQASAPAAPGEEIEPQAAAEDKPEDAEEEEPAPQEYSHKRVPISTTE